MIYQVSLTAAEIEFVVIALLAAKQEISIRVGAPENYDPEVDALIEKIRAVAE